MIKIIKIIQNILNQFKGYKKKDSFKLYYNKEEFNYNN